jgi:hypothetical protein
LPLSIDLLMRLSAVLASAIYEHMFASLAGVPALCPEDARAIRAMKVT